MDIWKNQEKKLPLSLFTPTWKTLNTSAHCYWFHSNSRFKIRAIKLHLHGMHRGNVKQESMVETSRNGGLPEGVEGSSLGIVEGGRSGALRELVEVDTPTSSFAAGGVVELGHGVHELTPTSSSHPASPPSRTSSSAPFLPPPPSAVGLLDRPPSVRQYPSSHCPFSL